MPKVLLIDDDPDVRRTFALMLETLEADVIEATNGAEGVALYLEHAPHLVITDIMMPVMDGIETVKEIRAIDPHAQIIALSGGGRGKYENPLALAQQMGAAASLEKPVKLRELREMVQLLLEDRM